MCKFGKLLGLTTVCLGTTYLYTPIVGDLYHNINNNINNENKKKSVTLNENNDKDNTELINYIIKGGF
jgi:hypothetical protein